MTTILSLIQSWSNFQVFLFFYEIIGTSFYRVLHDILGHFHNNTPEITLETEKTGLVLRNYLEDEPGKLNSSRI